MRLITENDGNDVAYDALANQNHSAKSLMEDACLLLRIDNILLYAELTSNHNAIYIDDNSVENDKTFMQMWETADEAAKRNELTPDEKWWNLRDPNRYIYDKWSHQLTNPESATISSIERL